MSRKQLRIAKDAAEEALRIKSQFLADLSHEIRTPMTVIIGMSELILETGLDGHQRELAATIRNCAQNLLVVLDDTLDFSAIAAITGSSATLSNTVTANSVNYFQDGANTIVWADTDGNTSTVEFQVTLTGVTASLLVSSDFLL